jgi:hypothetical protein
VTTAYVDSSFVLGIAFAKTQATGLLRGADLWDVACALFVAGGTRREVAFLSRDRPQRLVATRLGFTTP